MSNDLLETATHALRETSVRPGPAPDVLQMVEQMPSSKQSNRLLTRRWFLSAASIAIVAVAIAAIFLTQRPGNEAFAAVAQAIGKTQTFTAEIQIAPLPQPFQFSAKGNRMRVDYPGTSAIIDRQSKTFLQLLPFTKTARRGGLSDDGLGGANVDLYGLLREYRTGREEALGEKISTASSLVDFA